MVAFAVQLTERAEQLPGVQSAGDYERPSSSCNCNTNWVRFVGKPYNGLHNEVNEREVSASYFAILHVELKSGRFFSEADDATRPNVAIINEAFAREVLSRRGSDRQEIRRHNLTPKSIMEIVGVVADFRDGGLDQEQWPAEYEPFNQSPGTYFSLVIRTSQDARSILPELAPMIHQVSLCRSRGW